jgi:hypothetical protein
VTVQTSSAEIQQPTGTSKICNHPPATEVWQQETGDRKAQENVARVHEALLQILRNLWHDVLSHTPSYDEIWRCILTTGIDAHRSQEAGEMWVLSGLLTVCAALRPQIWLPVV